MKRQHHVPFIFDMRGFWAEERVEGGLWNLKNPLFLSIYRFFKEKEKAFLREADQIVTLTHAAKDEILSWNIGVKAPFSVIPCCADTETFSPVQVKPEIAARWREKLGLAANDFVLTYLGSLGTWYMRDEMLDFYRVLKRRYPEAKFLILTPDTHLLKTDEKGVILATAPRDEVPSVLSLTTLGIFFIKQTFSKKASSATKMGEMLAMGIPVVTNAKLGDSDLFLAKHPVGVAVDRYDEASYIAAVDKVPELLQLSQEQIREAAKDGLSLDSAVATYRNLYRALAHVPQLA